jgi:arabinofuranosyltransferase
VTSPTLAAVVAAAGLMLVAVRIYSADQPVSDDAFITYRYAENLAGGHGFVFSRGAAPVQGTTTPLYTALLALGARLGADIPALSLVLGATALAAAAGLVVLLARDLGALAAGVAAALAWSASPLTW